MWLRDLYFINCCVCKYFRNINRAIAEKDKLQEMTSAMRDVVEGSAPSAMVWTYYGRATRLMKYKFYHGIRRPSQAETVVVFTSDLACTTLAHTVQDAV